MDYLKTYFWNIVSKQYFDFNGREGRKVFWLYTLNIFILGLILSAISQTLGYIVTLALLLPSLGLAVRRLHDINFKGWWVLLGAIPLVGTIALIIFYCLPGTKGENRFGSAK